MALRPQRGVGIRTPRDDARAAERLALAEHWAKVDADIADALGEHENKESADG